MTTLLESVFEKVRLLPESQQNLWATEWLSELEQAELHQLEQGRALELSDFLAQLEPDPKMHQTWLEVNRVHVRPAKYIVGRGLVVE